MWDSAGIVIRGVLTQALTKTSGPFAAGEKPGEADCKFRCPGHNAQSCNSEPDLYRPHHHLACPYDHQCRRRAWLALLSRYPKIAAKDGRAQLRSRHRQVLGVSTAPSRLLYNRCMACFRVRTCHASGPGDIFQQSDSPADRSVPGCSAIRSRATTSIRAMDRQVPFRLGNIRPPQEVCTP